MYHASDQVAIAVIFSKAEIFRGEHIQFSTYQQGNRDKKATPCARSAHVHMIINEDITKV